MKKSILGIVVGASLFAMAESADVVRDVVVQQQWPWSQEVAVTFKVGALESSQSVDVSLNGKVGDRTISIPSSAVRGLKSGLTAGEYTLFFNPTDVAEMVDMKTVPDFRAEVTATASAINPSEPLYMIVDLEAETGAAGQVTYLSRADILSGRNGAYEYNPPWLAPGVAGNDCLIWTGVTNDVYKTTKLVLRRIKAGTFTMGARDTDYPGAKDAQLHSVTLTRDFWIGVFELTQKQWNLVMGAKTFAFPGANRPADKISYDIARGTDLGAYWPDAPVGGDRHDVDADSFMGKLRAKVPGLTFDLPTEAQWQYACRAGTDTALNSGKNLTDQYNCPNLAELGRYASNTVDNVGGYAANHTTVGSYAPNAWGLYDMHGNVWEWCLDWYQSIGSADVTDPLGPMRTPDNAGKVYRINIGGVWDVAANLCRSGNRHYNEPSYGKYQQQFGMRVAVFID